MKAHKILLLLMPLVASCSRIASVECPDDFDVRCEKTQVKVGESVKFFISGNPDVISFYSGEVGNDYNHISGRIAVPEYVVTFDEQAIDGKQEDQLSVLVSLASPEGDTWDAISSHNGWLDISDRFTLLGPGKVTNNRVYTNVGSADVSDLLTSDEMTICFAFHYTAQPWSSGNESNIIRVKNFKVQSKYNGKNTDLYDWNDCGWKMYTQFPQQSSRPSEIQEKNKVIQFRIGWGNHEDGSGTYQGDGADNWAVSNGLKLQKTLDMGPDRSVGIKGLNDVQKEIYEHTYDVAGVYEVVFVAQNVNITGSQAKIVKLQVEVTE